LKSRNKLKKEVHRDVDKMGVILTGINLKLAEEEEGKISVFSKKIDYTIEWPIICFYSLTPRSPLGSSSTEL
jgi:hypothetical protein